MQLVDASSTDIRLLFSLVCCMFARLFAVIFERVVFSRPSLYRICLLKLVSCCFVDDFPPIFRCFSFSLSPLDNCFILLGEKKYHKLISSWLTAMECSLLFFLHFYLHNSPFQRFFSQVGIGLTVSFSPTPSTPAGTGESSVRL